MRIVQANDTLLSARGHQTLREYYTVPSIRQAASPQSTRTSTLPGSVALGIVTVNTPSLSLADTFSGSARRGSHTVRVNDVDPTNEFIKRLTLAGQREASREMRSMVTYRDVGPCHSISFTAPLTLPNIVCITASAVQDRADFTFLAGAPPSHILGNSYPNKRTTLTTALQKRYPYLYASPTLLCSAPYASKS